MFLEFIEHPEDGLQAYKFASQVFLVLSGRNLAIGTNLEETLSDKQLCADRIWDSITIGIVRVVLLTW